MGTWPLQSSSTARAALRAPRQGAAPACLVLCVGPRSKLQRALSSCVFFVCCTILQEAAPCHHSRAAPPTAYHTIYIAQQQAAAVLLCHPRHFLATNDRQPNAQPAPPRPHCFHLSKSLFSSLCPPAPFVLSSSLRACSVAAYLRCCCSARRRRGRKVERQLPHAALLLPRDPRLVCAFNFSAGGAFPLLTTPPFVIAPQWIERSSREAGRAHDQSRSDRACACACVCAHDAGCLRFAATQRDDARGADDPCSCASGGSCAPADWTRRRKLGSLDHSSSPAHMCIFIVCFGPYTTLQPRTLLAVAITLTHNQSNNGVTRAPLFLLSLLLSFFPSSEHLTRPIGLLCV